MVFVPERVIFAAPLVPWLGQRPFYAAYKKAARSVFLRSLVSLSGRSAHLQQRPVPSLPTMRPRVPRQHPACNICKPYPHSYAQNA
ncbi:hypothetical protein HK27_04910 [Acetobacter orientalis]|nr:hypothetical protein HK27_04910 [Acetobacter orientalis]